MNDYLPFTEDKFADGGKIWFRQQIVDVPERNLYNQREFSRMRREFAIALLDGIEKSRSPVVVDIHEERREVSGYGPTKQITVWADLTPVHHEHVTMIDTLPTVVTPLRSATLMERIRFLFTRKI